MRSPESVHRILTNELVLDLGGGSGLLFFNRLDLPLWLRVCRVGRKNGLGPLERIVVAVAAAGIDLLGLRVAFGVAGDAGLGLGARMRRERGLSWAMGLYLPAFLMIDRVGREHLQDFFTGVGLGAWAAFALLLLTILLSLSLGSASNSG